MKQIERIGVSLDKKLLAGFDKLISSHGYQSRSEAIRDLIRQKLSRDKLTNPKARALAVVLLVYDHHSANLMEKLLCLQHSHLFQTISSMHIHLDHHNCLEVIVLKGQAGQINKVAQKIVSLKGVRLGKVNFMSTQSA